METTMRDGYECARAFFGHAYSPDWDGQQEDQMLDYAIEDFQPKEIGILHQYFTKCLETLSEAELEDLLFGKLGCFSLRAGVSYSDEDRKVRDQIRYILDFLKRNL